MQHIDIVRLDLEHLAITGLGLDEPQQLLAGDPQIVAFTNELRVQCQDTLVKPRRLRITPEPLAHVGDPRQRRNRVRFCLQQPPIAAECRLQLAPVLKAACGLQPLGGDIGG